MKTTTAPKKALTPRTQRVIDAIARTMELIRSEVEANGGVYLFNNGRLTQAELCRRSGVSPVTLQNANHKGSTLVWVNSWLKEISRGSVVREKARRRSASDRAEYWKSEFAAVATSYNLSRIEVAELRTELCDLKLKNEEMMQRIEEKEAEIAELRSALAQDRVRSYPAVIQRRLNQGD